MAIFRGNLSDEEPVDIYSFKMQWSVRGRMISLTCNVAKMVQTLHIDFNGVKQASMAR